MRHSRTLLPILALAALSACGSTTAPTDEDLVGTWTIEPAAVALPGGGLQQMTVHIGGQGEYTLETATYGGFGAGELMAYQKTVGSVTVEDGGLHFHPTGSLGWDRRHAAHVDLPLFDAKAWQSRPVPYQVHGDQLVLRAPAGGSESMVLTRQDQDE
jgi:hypothetical protein